MKRIITITLTLILTIPVLFLTSCSKKDKTTKDKTTKTITTDENHVHEFGDWKIVSSSTCTEHGTKKRTCACGKVEYEDLPLLDHVYEDDKCVNCGEERLSEGFDIEFFEPGSKYYIKGYNGTSTSVRITRAYDDGEHGYHPIDIQLGKDSSDNLISCLKDANIKTLKVAEGFEEIPSHLFYGITNLEELILPDSLRTISEAAFKGCSKLETVIFNEGLLTIGFAAFSDCNIKTIDLPYSLTTISLQAFSNNVNLKEVNFNSNLETVEENAFSNTAIERLVLPKQIKTFKYQLNLPKLESITIDGTGACYHAENNCLIFDEDNSIVLAAKNATIPSSAESIDVYAFAYHDYSSTTTFVIPSSVTYISYKAFANTKFNKLSMSNVTYLERSAFEGATFTDTSFVLELPSTLGVIESNCFDSVTINGVVIPITVTKLGEKIFINANISSVTIHDTTTKSEDCDIDWSEGLSPSVINLIED